MFLLLGQIPGTMPGIMETTRISAAQARRADERLAA